MADTTPRNALSRSNKSATAEALKDLRERHDRNMASLGASIDSVQASFDRIQKILDRMQKRFNQN